MLERSEQDRLSRLYETLREKLLDLSKKNRMLNYPVGGRGKRQLQIVDEVLEEVYGRLATGGAPLRIVPLEEPESTPPEERTPEFLAALEHAKVADLDYQTKLEALVASGRDDEFAVQLLERALRDDIRKAFDLPARPKRAEINRAEHARKTGIDPNPELSAAGTRAAHRDNRLQTLKYPDELESTLEKIAADARLAEQEAGLSTLFLTFGFLEWYDSDTSEKPYYAPLVLLPVKLSRTKVRGHDVYDLSASEGAETNVSLQRFLERDHGRALPEFGSADPEEPASIEAYLDEVRAAIEGKKRWQVRRWLMLGHFAFTRIAIYEDTDPKRWDEHPVTHALVGSLLSGFETSTDAAARGFRAPDDYRIDDPEIEKIAPFLIHDADASQHSALIDVMKAKNLVIEGPPGTGKSQTITNVIANALAAGKSVLFLAEKQAALDVVKRRMDSAGLGDFCLELHSEKSSPKAVIKSLSDRHSLGSGERQTGTHGVDPTWAMSRAQIAEYLEALHAADSDSETPFRLIWQAIRGRSANADADTVLRAPLSPGAIAADTLQRLRGELAIHAGKAQHFLDVHGHAATSPWAITPPGDVPAYDHEALLSALQAWRTALAERAVIVERQRAMGIETDADAAAAKAADARLPEAPDPAALLSLLAVPEMAQLGEGLELLSSLYSARSRVAALAVAEYDRDDLVRAAQLARRIKREDYLARTPAEIYRLAESNIARNRSFIDAVAALRPAIEAFGPADSVPASHVEAIAKTVASLAGLDEARAAWMSAEAEGPVLERVYQRWLALRREEGELRTAMPGADAPWPSADDLDAARAALLKTGFAKLFGQKPGREMLDRLRLPDAPSSRDLLQRLSTHVRNTMAFAADADGRALLGARWAALATPLDAAVDAARLRSDLRVKLGAIPGGAQALAALTAMAPATILSLRPYRAAAESYVAGLAEFRNVADATPLGSAVTRAETNLVTLQGLLALDPGRALAEHSESLADLAAKDDAAAARDAAETRLGQSAIADELRRLAPDEAALARSRAAIEWIRVVQRSGLPAQLATALLSAEAGAVRRRLHDEASERARADVATNRALEELAPFGFAGFDGIAPTALQSHLDALLTHANELTDFVALQRTRRELDNAGLEQFLRAADAALLTPLRLPALFNAAVARRRAEAARRASRPLSERNGGDLEARRAAFVERDRQKKNTDRAVVKATLLGRHAPSGLRAGPVKTWTEMHLLAREFPKQRAFTPVRSLLARAGGAVRALKPCFMMSPLSLAKFLSPGQFEFDLLVIDEASQMKPEDALGAMLRAKQIVVVGDPKQLPPTSFFDRSATAAEGTPDGDGDDVDDESILDRCQKVFGDVRSLKWHYRSRCESLIRFSNDAFYQGRLITFPAAIPRSFSVDLVRVDGSFQASRNLVEAERICEEAISFMRDYADLDEPPTLGIVALNTEQRDLIQEMLWRLSAEDDLVARYAEKVEARGEPPFVKNLENVQGDERDYILISLTYGRAPGVAAMAQRFGPINSKQGHRRLNVLFSRARVRIGLFASFGSSDVKPTEGANQGVHVLKQYLEYAETRGRTAANRIGGVPDSDFEVEVAERLRSRGYEIDPQVGVSGFRIDLGVRHPDRPDTFLAGIECDGAAYHGSRSARDRDRLREEVLRGLGWAILRVWSTDWFDNPDAQTERLVNRLEDLRHEPDPHAHGPRRFGLPAEGAAAEELAVEQDSPTHGDSAEPNDRGENDGVATSAVVKGDTEPTPTPAGEGVPIAPDHAGTTGNSAVGEALLQGDAPLSEAELMKALVAFRETVVRPTAGANWDPQRSILRDGMIETLVRQRIEDPEDWFRRVPLYQRSATEPNEKRLYLDRICAIIARLEGGSGQTRSPSTGAATEAGVAEGPQAEFRLTAIEPSGRPAAPTLPLPGFARPSADPGVYERTDFTALGLTPQRDAFYDSDYRPNLIRLVTAVIEAEGPIYEDVLAVRIARAHGMERTGATIQLMVAGAVDRRFARSSEEDRTVFWPPNARPDRPFAHRSSPEGVRSHADTPLAELAGLALPFLRLGMDDETVIGRMAQHFRLGRLRAVTRLRFEKAIALAKSHLGA